MRYFISVGIILILTLSGCKKKETTGTGGVIENTFGIMFCVGEEGTIGFVLDTLGNPIADAVVILNGDTIYPFANIYADTSIKFQAGQTYNLYVETSMGTASATVTAPNINGVTITSPDSGAVLSINSPIEVEWTYNGGTNDGKVFVSFSYDDEDTIRYYTWPGLDGSTTNHTIPASAVTKTGDVTILVTAGNYHWFETLYPLPPQYGYYSIFIVAVEDVTNVTISGE